MADAVASISAAAELLDRGLLSHDEFVRLKLQILAASAAAPAEAKRSTGRLLQLTWHVGPQQEGAAAEKSAETLRRERKAADEAAFKRM